jgi:GTP-binding protein Era
MNALWERLSIITSKAQTTRHRILGIVNGEDFQMILSDTLGLLSCIRNASIDDELVKSAFEDGIIYMVEIGEQDLKDEAFFKNSTFKIPVLLLLNKIDNLIITKKQVAFDRESA